MQQSISYKTKQFLWLVVKLFIVIGCGYFIVVKFTQNEQLSFADFLSKATKNNVFSLKNIVFLLFFSVFNWFFEISKWKILISSIQKTTFKAATIQSLASLTTSLVTPNRIGEYGAKALYFKKENSLQIVGLNFIGNFYQMGITVLFGSIGLIYFENQHAIHINLYHLFTIGFTFLFLGIFLVWTFKYFPSIQSRIQKLKTFIHQIKKITYLKVGLYALAKYFIFSHQFYFLIYLFNFNISYTNAITTISSMYLISSCIPMFSLFDAILKGSIAVWFFSYFKIDVLSILSITTLMWTFNFAIPTIIGSYFVMSFKSPFRK